MSLWNLGNPLLYFLQLLKVVNLHLVLLDPHGIFLHLLLKVVLVCIIVIVDVFVDNCLAFLFRFFLTALVVRSLQFLLDLNELLQVLVL